MSQYEVIVGNIGTVYQGSNLKQANERYKEYVKQSKRGLGRAGGESVTMMKGGEIHKEHQGIYA
jgi:hypothetical protein